MHEPHLDRRRREERLFLRLLAGGILFLVLGCLGGGGLWALAVADMERPRVLPNGYRLTHMKGYGWYVYDGGGSGVIPGRPDSDTREGVIGVAVIGDIVIGRAADAITPPANNGGLAADYFILNTKTGRRRENLAREAVKQLLAEWMQGETADIPKLRDPSRFPRARADESHS